MSTKAFWASDAIRMLDLGAGLEDVVHRTRVIDRFLEGDKFFVSAGKGMGKTLLLALKRYRLENGVNKAGAVLSAGTRFVPSGKPYLDVMGDLPTLTRENQEAYSSLDQSKRIWRMALQVSALSCVGVPHVRNDALSPQLLEAIKGGRQLAPTEAFHEMASLTVSKMNAACDHAQEIERAFRQIQSAVAIFIDRVDQGLMSLSRGPWVALQLGLIEAAWDLMSTNSHVRIFATIRQEAFSSMQSPTHNNLIGAVTEVSYDEEDLQRLLDRLTRRYEAQPTFDAFTGVGSVDNVYAGQRESAFRYMYRHSLGRPRDLVQVAERLSLVAPELSEKRFQTIVNREFAPIVAQIFEELRVFLDCLRNEDERRRFFSLIPYNVLTRDELISIYCRFNGIEGPETIERRHTAHPFFELHAAGLLGVLKDDVSARCVQSFRRPSEAIVSEVGHVAWSSYYLIHPSVEEMITAVNQDYEVLRFAPVGQGCEWSLRTTSIVQVQRVIHGGLHRAALTKDERDRRNNLKQRALSVLEIVHARGRPGDENRRQLLREHNPDPWHELEMSLANKGDDRELHFWLERTVMGGRH